MNCRRCFSRTAGWWTPLVFIAACLFAACYPATAQESPAVELESLPDQRLRIQWPETTNVVSLESSVELGAAQFWQPVFPEPEGQNGLMSVTISPQLNREFFRLRNEGPPPLTTIAQSSPAPGEANVSVNRETILHFTRPLALSTALHSNLLYATFAERRILSRITLSGDRRSLTLFYLEPLPGGSRVRVTFDATGLFDDLGRPVDADGDGQDGGAVWMDFDTSSVQAVPGTAVIGHVFASESMSDGNGGFTNRPLENVTVTVDGAEETLRTTTDANGFFTLEPCPSGRFFVHVDGRTSIGSDWPGGAYYPFVGKAWEAVAGRTNLAGGSGEIFLPLIASDALQPVSMVEDTMVTFPSSVLAQNPALAGVSIMVPANSLFADDGQRGGSVGLAPVPPDRLPEPLPEGLEFPLVITVQTDGPLNFDVPAPVRFPNLPDPVTGVKLGPGEKTALWSFNHDTGRWEIQGPMTVTEDGEFVESDPGVGIRQPGWHGVALGAALQELFPRKACFGSRACGGAIAMSLVDITFAAVAAPLRGGVCFYMAAQWGVFRSAIDCKTGDLGDCVGSIFGNGLGLASCAASSIPGIGVAAALPSAALSIYRNCGACGPGGVVSASMVSAAATIPPRHELELEAHIEFLAAYKEFIDLYLGSTNWTTALTPETANPREVSTQLGDVLGAMFASMAAASSEGPLITDIEAAGVRAFPLPAGFSESDVDHTIEHINRTITFYRQGIFTHAAAGRSDFVDANQAETVHARLLAAGDMLQALGIRTPDLLKALSTYQTGEAQRMGVAVPRTAMGELYYVIEEVPEGEGAVVRGRLAADGRLGLAAVRPLAVYKVTFFDPSDQTWGTISFRSANVGRATAVPPLLLVPLDGEMDSDNDQLPDVAEFVVGTNAGNPDTDNDGIADGVEVRQGTNPLDNLPVRTGVIASAPTSTPALHVAVHDGVAVTANGVGGITVFDVRNPFLPARVAEVNTPGNALAVATSGTVVAVADGGSGLAIVDISDPPASHIVRQIPMGSTAQSVAIEGGVVHVGLTSGEVVTVDLETGRVLNRYPLPAIVDDISVAGDYVHVLTRSALVNLRWSNDGFATLGSVNISGSPSPQETGRKIFAGGGLAYVGYFTGYSIVNVSNPESPIITGSPPASQTAVHDLAANGSGLLLNITSFAGASTFALSLYDISDPTDVTQFLISHDTPGTSRAVAIHNGLAFVADGTGGLQVVNYLAYDALGQPPAIEIGGNFAVTNGIATVQEDQPARISALVSDDVQVRNVEFYLDGERAFTDGSFPFEYRFAAPPITVARSNFTVRARALDTGGNVAWSDEIPVLLLPDPTPPVVRSMSPPPGAYIGRIATVRLNFSKSLDLSSLSGGALWLAGAGPDELFDTDDDFVPAGLTTIYLEEDRAAVMSVDDYFPPGAYRVIVSDTVQDLRGNHFEEPFVAAFQTGNFADNDSDGLPDFLEPALGFDFLNPDTLGIGGLDGELDLNTNGFSAAADYFAGRPMTPVLVPGSTAAGTLTVGAMARYEFEMESGKTVIVAAGGSGLTPSLLLFGPDGGLIAAITNNANPALGYLAASNGTYRVLLGSQNPNQSGTYNLVMMRIPDDLMIPDGEDGGALTNGGNHAGTIEVGDVDLWTFTANAGDQVWLRLATTTAYPSLSVFGPTGTVVGSASDGSNTRDAVAGFAAPATGTFTVLVRSHYSGGSGPYVLYYAKVPGAFIVPVNDEGGALTNGVNHAGTIERGDLDLWTFTASQGEQVLLRLASTTVYPAFTVYAPDGTQTAADYDGSNTRDARAAFIAGVTGTFTVVARSYYEGGAGPYALSYAKVPGSFIVAPDDEGGALTNGGNHAGTIERGDLELWTFTAEQGDQVWLRMGTTSLYPALAVYGPNGAEIASDYDGSNTRDAGVVFAAPLSGTFTVVAQSHYDGGTGPFVLSYAKIPGQFSVPAGDEGGVLTNGSNHEGTIAHGDLDLWTFTAEQGDQVWLRLASTAVYPAFTVYGPDGTEVAADHDSTSSRDARAGFTAPMTGRFTVIARSYYDGGSGTYSLHYVKVPGGFIVPAGDEGGALTNGANHAGALTWGDLDVWTFSAEAGNNVLLRLATTTVYPNLIVYGPDHEVAASAFSTSSARDVSLAFVAEKTGVFTVVVQSHFDGHTGTYTLQYVKAPGEFIVPAGDDGGAMTNGFRHGGTLSSGDLDVWKFDASPGEGLMLRMGTTNLTPHIRVFAPSGALLQEAASGSSFNRDNHLTLQATSAGTYTVIVTAALAGQSGSYVLTLARSPAAFVTSSGDEGGALTNGAIHSGEVSIGDLDLWSFSANAGNTVILRMGVTNGGCTPWIRIYGPNGALVDEASSSSSFNRDNVLTLPAAANGTYTVVVSASLLNQEGSYNLYFAQTPGAFVVPGGDEGGVLTGGAVHPGTMSLGDLDLWSFNGVAGQSITLTAQTVDFTPWIRVYGPGGALVAEFTSTSSFLRSAVLSHTMAQTGTYTVVFSAALLGQSGSYDLEFDAP